MRELTTEEIEELACQEGARRIAVENFLMTVTNNEKEYYANMNLEEDAIRYKWNKATKSAICKGIRLEFG